jgi:two-component system phosphate regulon sensor histidine kinase PhoR
VTSTILWQAIWIGLSFAMGALAVAVGRSESPGASLLAGLAACLAAGLAWWTGRRWQRSVEALRQYVGRWDVDLETAELRVETIPEVEPLRFALQQAQRSLRSAHGQRDQRISELLRDTALLQSVLGTMVEAVLVLDGDGRVLYANPAAQQLLESGEREAAGRLLHEVARTPRLHDFVAGVLQSGEERRGEVELSRQQRLVMASCAPLKLEQRIGAVLVLNDVTELRRLEQARREFASNVSHELKTPLTSIQAYADALLDGALDDSAVNRGFVERILEQTERLHRLILDLLNLARIESDDHGLEVTAVDLNAAVEQVVPQHLSVAESRRLTLRLELAPVAPIVTADPDALRTVLDNLVRNAINYTPPGGNVTVRTLLRERAPCLEVQDTGIGIPREHQQRIFERFYRVDKARSREVGGTGLGLSIVKHFVEHFGAVVELESEQGRGSLFRVRWPRG